jgi:prepilin-type N-terminal cleavage/methylation domain-containing protein
MYKLDNSNLRNIHHNESGFTLIEVLIAIILLAFISLYTFKMVDNSTDTKERVLKEDQTKLQSLTAISRLDSDISQLYTPLFAYSKANPAADPNAVYQDNATSKGTFDGKAKNGAIVPQFQSDDKSTLVFLTAANRRKVADAKESRYTWVKYSIRRSEKKENEGDEKNLNTKGDSELIRQSISTNIYTQDLNWNDVRAQILMTQIKSLEFSFWDERSKKFVGSLQDLNENKNLIRSLKMELVWVDENNVEQKIVKIFRVLHPYFNTKLDDMGTVNGGGAYGDSSAPPGIPDPNNPNGSSSGGGGIGGPGVHL